MATHCEVWLASSAVSTLFISQGDFGYFLLLREPHIQTEQPIGGSSTPQPVPSRTWSVPGGYEVLASDCNVCLQLLLSLLTYKNRACLKPQGPAQDDQPISQY